MGCQLSLSRNCQEQQQPPSRGELRFCSGDLLDIQILLWNVLIIYSGDEKTRNHKGISKAIKIIRQSSTDIGYDIPTDEDLASRLLTDAVERESQLDDLHIVHKLETEQEVIALVMHTDSTPLLKPAALEILCQWYVESEDCNNMIDLVSSSPIQFPVASSIPQGTDFQKSSCCESYQSFAWEPSSVDNIASGSLHGVDMNSFQSDCKSSTSVQRQRSSSTATAASITGGYQPSSFIREIVTSSQLRFVIFFLHPNFCMVGNIIDPIDHSSHFRSPFCPPCFPPFFRQKYRLRKQQQRTVRGVSPRRHTHQAWVRCLPFTGIPHPGHESHDGTIRVAVVSILTRICDLRRDVDTRCGTIAGFCHC